MQWRMRKRGWQISCVPAAQVTHIGGASASQQRPASLVNLWRSRLQLCDKHYSAPKRTLARQLIIAGMNRRISRLSPDEAELEACLPRSHSLGARMTQLTAIVLTYNEIEHIGACLETLRFADRVLVFDSFSDDGTVETARRLGAKVMQNAFVNYADQRNAALAALEGQGEWALFIDAAERVSPELAVEIREAISQADYVGWQIPRHNTIFGVLTKGAGWYPDYQTRLLRLGHASYDPERPVHEIVQLRGPAWHTAPSNPASQLSRSGALPRKAAALQARSTRGCSLTPARDQDGAPSLLPQCDIFTGASSRSRATATAGTDCG